MKAFNIFIIIVALTVHFTFYNVAQHIHQINPGLFYKQDQCKRINDNDVIEYLSKNCTINNNITNNNITNNSAINNTINNSAFDGIVINCTTFNILAQEFELGYPDRMDEISPKIASEFLEYTDRIAKQLEPRYHDCKSNSTSLSGYPESYLIAIIWNSAIFLAVLSWYQISDYCFETENKNGKFLTFSALSIIIQILSLSRQFILIDEMSKRTTQYNYILYPFLAISIQLMSGSIMGIKDDKNNTTDKGEEIVNNV